MCKEEIKKERQEELIFEVKEVVIEPDWGITTPVLVEQKRALNSWQREKVEELRELFGVTALFLRLSGHINADELPVQTGQRISLKEVLELTKNTEAYKRKEKLKKKKEKKLEEAKKKAKESGEKVKLYSYPIECTDPNEECNVDIVTVYVTPSGETDMSICHTF
jgi:hypothetical protein